MGRYSTREVYTNNHKNYKEVIRKRGARFIRQYGTPILRHPTSDEIGQLQLIGHTWGLGDRYYKLAEQHYGDPEKWWVIAWFNQKPTESHVEDGETIYIPLPLDRVLQLFNV